MEGELRYHENSAAFWANVNIVAFHDVLDMFHRGTSYTPLVTAAFCGQLESIRVLIQIGAAVDGPRGGGRL